MSAIPSAPSPFDSAWDTPLTPGEAPEINLGRIHDYRMARLREALARSGAAMAILMDTISLRYAVDFRSFSVYQTHIPTAYLFLSADGPTVMHGSYDANPWADAIRPARALSFFDGGPELHEQARLLADDVVRYLAEIGTDNRRVALERGTSPSVVEALLQRGLEVVDGWTVAEWARAIKSPEEVEGIRWAIRVAEHGIERLRAEIRPGVRETELWGLLSYTNLAHGGDWNEGRMLASGARINPWYQEATRRQIEAGDLVGFDTDMVGPFGFLADVSRTLFCGPGRPTRRQKQLYRLAVEEITHNLALIRPGVSFQEFQRRAYEVPEAFHENAYCCVIHGAGLCDEYPRVNPVFRGATPYDGVIQAGMVLCVESYMGAVGERDGVKLEQQILVTEDGYELLSTDPLDDALLD